MTGSKSQTTNFTWDYALWSIEQAGPTFIKLVQWATTRHDIFHPEFISRLSALQDNTRGHTWNDTSKQLIKSYGPNYHDILDFGKSNNSKNKYLPIGSGCVAQVYKATLKQDINLNPAGTEVAIKVTHPNILHKVCVDFYILNTKYKNCIQP